MKLNNNKITLSEFWESKENLAIHCDTEEKARILCKAFAKMGKKWVSNESYIEQNNWEEYRRYTCYGNSGGYCYLDWYEENGYTIYEFEGVIF